MMLAGLCAAALITAPLSPSDARAYGDDVDFIVSSIEKSHPAPFEHITKSEFLKEAAAIKATAPLKGVGCATVELMALVAELHDGHTYVAPINVPKQERWFPIRFYVFPEGLYVTSASPAYVKLVGKRVLRLGAIDAGTAMKNASAVQAANNTLAASEGAVWLSNASIAEAFGAADSQGGIAWERRNEQPEMLPRRR